MGKIWWIIRREYWTRVRKKSFILATLLAPLGFAFFFLAVVFINEFSNTRKMIYVVDQSGLFKNKLKDADDKTVYFKFTDENLDSLRNQLATASYDGILYVPADFSIQYPNNIKYFASKQLGLKPKSYIEKELEKVLRNEKIQRYNMDEDLLADLDTDVTINSVIVGVDVESRAGYSELASVIGMMSGFAIYITLFVYGTMVMKGVVEEKTNRIVEVLISSVRPFQLLLGKIIGIGAVGVTQFALWGILVSFTYFILGLAFGGSLQEMQQTAATQQANQISEEQVYILMESIRQIDFTPIILYFIFYFVGGYLLYGALFAAIGSATNDDGDMQSLTVPVTIPIIISIIIMIAVVNEPDSSLAFWASIIPFSSPIVMPALIPFEIDPWHKVVSMVCLIGGFLFTTWLAAKIYRTGILMYGKKISLRELGKWLWYSN